MTGGMIAVLRPSLVALCCLVLAGCGTSIKYLLEEESRKAPRAT